MTLMQPITARPSFPGRRDMEWIEGGSFLMGSDDHDPEERPKRRVQVEGFWIDRCPVSNSEFGRFVAATGYVAVPRRLGATGREADLGDYPAVQLTLVDVEAYAAWAGTSLPTEKEWEYAAQGGPESPAYRLGDFGGCGLAIANAWRQALPDLQGRRDETSAPIGRGPPNGYGLYDMLGNVWEWTEDWWSKLPIDSPVKVPANVRRAASADPSDPLQVPRRVLKGGARPGASGDDAFRPSARMAHPIDRPASHVGFRCVIRSGSAV